MCTDCAQDAATSGLWREVGCTNGAVVGPIGSTSDSTPRRASAARRCQLFGTKREAEKALDEVVHSAETGSVVSRSTMRLSEFLDNWVAGQSQHLRETTQHSYEMAVKRVKPKLGVVALQALTTLQVERFYAELGGVTGTTSPRWRARSPRKTRGTTYASMSGVGGGRPRFDVTVTKPPPNVVTDPSRP